jgi:hypothetical protein
VNVQGGWQWPAHPNSSPPPTDKESFGGTVRCNRASRQSSEKLSDFARDMIDPMEASFGSEMESLQENFV